MNALETLELEFEQTTGNKATNKVKYSGPIYTKYSYLTTDEFINLIQDKIGNSPLIDELISRLDIHSMGILDDLEIVAKDEEIIVGPDTNSVVKCSVCESKLEIGINIDTNSLYVIG